MPRLRFGKLAGHGDAFNKAALVVAFLVVLVNVHRRLVLDALDPYKCSALVTQGQWLDPPERKPERRPFQTWHVPGCILHSYNTPEIATCLGDGKILFVGDAGIRQIFWAVARKIEGGGRWVDGEQERRRYGSGDEGLDNMQYEAQGARLEFLWDPWLNGSTLQDELRMFQDDASKEDGTERKRAAVILIGGGLWHARHFSEEADSISRFEASVDAILSTAYGNISLTNLQSAVALGAEGIGDRIFFAPVIEPVFEVLSPSREATVLPSKINAMNSYLRRQSDRGVDVLWTYSNMTRDRLDTYQESGIHVIEAVAGRMADVVLNLRCNAKTGQYEDYSDRSCCNAYRSFTWIQAFSVLSTIILPLVVFKFTKSVAVDSHSIVAPTHSAHITPLGSTPLALLVIFLAAAYCLLADRTQVFDKYPRLFFNFDFRVMLAIAVGGCLPSIKILPKNPNRRQATTQESPARYTFLSRLQSEEFKGWMQIYVLIHSYTSASDSLDFYRVLRVFLAFYLFLSGWGHTIYFLRSQDYSLQRAASVILRLNTLPVILTFFMNRPYSSYYFAPLVTFWFLVVYATLRALSSFNNSLLFLLGKIGLSALAVTAFIHVPGVLEATFTVLRVSCRANLDTEDWRVHLGTDKYIVFVGMFSAAVSLRVHSILRTPRDRLTPITRPFRQYFPLLHMQAIVLAVVALPTFWIMAREGRGKTEYEQLMAYVSFLPILSFVILRNATRLLRKHYCASFAFLGSITLELYLLSNHMWLAGDGHGLLRVGFRSGDGGLFSDRWRDLVILTPLLTCTAWWARRATMRLTAWVLGEEDGDEGQESGVELPNYENGWRQAGTSTTETKAAGDEGRQGSSGSGLKRRLMVMAGMVWMGGILR